jgi:hypothetical protein
MARHMVTVRTRCTPVFGIRMTSARAFAFQTQSVKAYFFQMTNVRAIAFGTQRVSSKPRVTANVVQTTFFV